MPSHSISASSIRVNAWDKPRQLADDVATELSIAGLHCTCFDRERAAALETGAEVHSDLLSTVIPAGLQLVRDPFGNTAAAYGRGGLTPVLRGNQSVATYFVDELLPTDAWTAIREQVEHLAIADPCCANGVAPASTANNKSVARIAAPFGGGRTCSTLMFRSDNPSVPLTFHLKMDDVWDGRDAPGPGILENGMDHFLIPSKSPGNSVVWLAIPRADDPQTNYDNLKKWEKGQHRFAAFDGILYTSDALKISVALDATPAG